MRKLSDQELFGMIPGDNGHHDPGNASNRISLSLKSAYELALCQPGIFPEHLHFEASASNKHEVEKRLKEKEKKGVQAIYEKAFPKIDKALENHLEASNGYIYEFPSAEKRIYEKADTEAFNYFKHGSDEYIPDTETNLRKAYLSIHDSCLRTFGWRLFWFLMAVAALALVLLGGKIYTLIPELEAWISQSRRNLYIHFGVIILFLQTIGWFVPARRLEFSFKDHTPAFFIILGAIFAWTVFYFLSTAGPIPDSEVGAVLYHIAKWPYLIYFAAVFVFHLVHLCKAIPDVVYYCTHLGHYKKEYVQVYEAEINRLHRYLRMRELWMEREKASEPFWLICFESRLKKYDKEYKKYIK